jgi:hypothetical protein
MTVQERSSSAGCQIFEADLVLFHYGELEESACQSVETHLKSCTACRDSLGEMKNLMPMTVARDEPPAPFWSDYSRELRAKLDTVAAKPSWWESILSWMRPIPMPALAAFAVVLLAVTFTVGKKYWDTPNAPDDDEVIALMSTDQDLDLLKNLEILDALDVLEAMGSDKGKG